jgi:hypothetical protein
MMNPKLVSRVRVPIKLMFQNLLLQFQRKRRYISIRISITILDDERDDERRIILKQRVKQFIR